MVKGNVDTSKVGEYKVEVIAIDKNGLKANKTFVVAVVEEKKEEQNSATVSNGTQAQPSKPSTPNTPPQQTCRPDVPLNGLANSGMFWAGNTDEAFKKADAWGESQAMDINSKWHTYSYAVLPVMGECGDIIGYTVNFRY